MRTVLISTPTFCCAYVRKIQPGQFARLRLAIVGAERLREPIAAAFKQKFGIDLIEGYGCTEMAPVVAVNVPDAAGTGSRPGTVGRPLPGISAKVVDPDTGDGPLIDQRGTAARHRSEPDARLPWRAGADAGSAARGLVCHR